ncbi:MAG: tetratricopeptide repeat protein, partial [Anaerolineales bacterium]
AIELEPGHAAAHAGLAQAYYSLSSLHNAPREVMPKAKAAAQRALELDETLAEAHVSSALVRAYYDWDWQGAEKEFKRALELDPGLASSHEWHGLYLAHMGRSGEAATELKRAQELDPLSPRTNYFAAFPFYFARQYDRYIEQVRKVIELDPNFSFGPWGLGMAHTGQGRFGEAIEELQQTRRLDDSPQVLGDLGYAYAASGKRREAHRMIQELKDLSRRRYVSSYDIATVYGALGEKDQAFEWLQRAYEARDEQLTWLKVDPQLDPLRSDSRFASLLRKMGLSQ